MLSGGASRGAVQVGMLQALAEAGVKPDFIVGSSAGAINAVCFAANPTVEGAEELERGWQQVRTADVFPGGNLTRLWHLARRRDFLHRGDGIHNMLNRLVPVNDISDTVIPAHVATTHLMSGATTWWDAGPAVPILCASAAMPGLLPPVTLDGALHVDGAVTAAVPIDRAAALGADRIYVCDVGASRGRGSGPAAGAVGVLVASYAAARQSRVHADVSYHSATSDIMVLPTPPLNGIGPADFEAACELVGEAKSLVASYLEARSVTGRRRPAQL